MISIDSPSQTEIEAISEPPALTVKSPIGLPLIRTVTKAPSQPSPKVSSISNV